MPTFDGPTTSETLSTPALIAGVESEVGKLENLIKCPEFSAARNGLVLVNTINKLQSILETRIQVEKAGSLSGDLNNLVTCLRVSRQATATRILLDSVTNDGKISQDLISTWKRG